MSLCSAAVLFILLIISISLCCALLKGARRRVGYIISIVLMAFISLGLILYLLSGLLIFYRSYTEEPPEPEGPAISALPFDEPEEFELPSVPLQPDVLGLRDIEFGVQPVLKDINELSAYALYNFLHERHSFECFIPPELLTDEGQGHFLLSSACSNAMSYYLFSSYYIFDMYTEDRGDEEGVWANVSLEFSNPEYDSMAKEASFAFLAENLPPEEGFQDFESEKSYALKIHDYLGKKLLYSPVGYDPLLINGENRYTAKQEAYNALCEADNTAVCAAYARGFALIAQQAGIDCAFMQGNDIGEESHAWNIIFPCDGSEPVIVDVTWDDPPGLDIPEQTEMSRSYFYLPISLDNEHQSREDMRSFINYLHLIKGDNREITH